MDVLGFLDKNSKNCEYMKTVIDGGKTLIVIFCNGWREYYLQVVIEGSDVVVSVVRFRPRQDTFEVTGGDFETPVVGGPVAVLKRLILGGEGLVNRIEWRVSSNQSGVDSHIILL